jgi:cytidylate kinase
MFRVLTVSGEYGSGGADIARRVSERLGWQLLDKAFILEIARRIRVEPDLVQHFDERVASWLHRVSRAALWHGAFEGVAAMAPEDFFDAGTVAELARHVIEGAYERGNCVIVGRGAQCILQGHADALHVFIYAPRHQRIARIRQRLPAAKDAEELIRATDRQRAEYIRMHFGCNWSDPHLYHLLINSELGESLAASLIVDALARGSTVPSERQRAVAPHGE